DGGDAAGCHCHAGSDRRTDLTRIARGRPGSVAGKRRELLEPWNILDHLGTGRVIQGNSFSDRTSDVHVGVADLRGGLAGGPADVLCSMPDAVGTVSGSMADILGRMLGGMTVALGNISGRMADVLGRMLGGVTDALGNVSGRMTDILGSV